jgi:hypothetical protein
MSVGVMKDYKLKLRHLRPSHTESGLIGVFGFAGASTVGDGSSKVGREEEGLSSNRPELLALRECLEAHEDHVDLYG